MTENQFYVDQDSMLKDILIELKRKLGISYNILEDYEYLKGPYMFSINSFLARILYISNIPITGVEDYLRDILRDKSLIREPWLYEEQRANIYECMSPEYLIKLLQGNSGFFGYFKYAEDNNLSVKDFREYLIACGLSEASVTQSLKAYIVFNVGKINFENKDNLILSGRLLYQDNKRNEYVIEVLSNFTYICKASLLYLNEASNLVSNDYEPCDMSDLSSIFERCYQRSLLSNLKVFGKEMPDIAVYKFREQSFNEFRVFKDVREIESTEMIMDKMVGLQTVPISELRPRNKVRCMAGESTFLMFNNVSRLECCVRLCLLSGSKFESIGDMNYYIMSDIDIQDYLSKHAEKDGSNLKCNNLMGLLPELSSLLEITEIRNYLSNVSNYVDIDDFLSSPFTFVKIFKLLVKCREDYPISSDYMARILKLYVMYFIDSRNIISKECIDISEDRMLCDNELDTYTQNLKYVSNILTKARDIFILDYFKSIRYLSLESLTQFLAISSYLIKYEVNHGLALSDKAEEEDIILIEHNSIDLDNVEKLWDALVNISTGEYHRKINNSIAARMFFG